MTLPYTLTSTIDGLSAWAYDFDRNPTNDSNITNIATNDNNDYIIPVSHIFSKYDSNVHMVQLICDINHNFQANGTVKLLGAFTPDDASVSVDTHANYSQMEFTKLKVTENVSVSLTGAILRKTRKTPITTNSRGITITNQTGIVYSNRGYTMIIFTLADGFTIPNNTIITANGTIQNDYGNMVNAKPITFKTSYPMNSGSYLIRITDDQQLEKCSIDIPTISSTSKYNIKWNLSNCMVTPSDTIVDQGTHTWTFKADSGFHFDKTGGIYDSTISGYGNQIPATGTDTTTLTYDLEHDITIGLVASKLQGTTIPIKQTLTNVTSNVSGAEIDRKINQIIISAISGYQIKDDILVQLYTGSTVTQSFSVSGNNSNTITLPFNTNAQNTITDTMTNIVITANAVKPETSTGYSHYYAISNTELSNFSKEHIWTLDSSSSVDSYDVSKYIDNLIELPFKYDTTNLPTSKIAVGRVATNTTTHEIQDRFYTLDFGKIIVPAKYKNGYDYQIRECKIYLPFAPAVSIAIDNVMEQTIHIVYKIDISTGNATITLDNNGLTFNTLNINLADKMPFLNTLKNTIIRDGQHQIYNGIRNPYLVITRNQPILDSDYYPTREQNNISKYQGRLKATLLDDTGVTDYDDLIELENLLSNGVIYYS